MRVTGQYLKGQTSSSATPEILESVLSEAGSKMKNLLDGMIYLDPSLQFQPEVVENTQKTIQAILSLPVIEKQLPFAGSKIYPKAIDFILKGLKKNPQRWPVWYVWAFLSNLEKMSPTRPKICE